MILPILAASALVIPLTARGASIAETETPKPAAESGAPSNAKGNAKGDANSDDSSQRGVQADGSGSERVDLITDDNLVVKAAYCAPRGKSQRAPAALLNHDAGASRAQVEQIGAKLCKEGFAVLEIDLRGHGQSASAEFTWTKLDGPGQEKLWAFAGRDVDAGARWLSARSDVHSGNLTVVGVRAGGALAVRQAAKNENVRSIVLVDPAPKQYGFDLTRDLGTLGGTPAYIVVSPDHQDVGKSLVKAVSSGEKGQVEMTVCRAKGAEFLSDKKLTGEISRWAAEKAFPKRGEPR